jgi:hypothetical protein
MNRVVIESLLTGQMEKIEINLGKYSAITFDVAKKIGIIPKQKYCNILIHPEGDKLPSIATNVYLVSSIDGVDVTLQNSIFAEVADPFSVSWRTYLSLPPECAERLKERVWDENENWIREQIEQHDAAWILVCNRKILKWSKSIKEYPSRDELKEVANKYNLFPFVFARPPLIEESSWNKINTNDYYPTLKISVDKKLDLIGDMDTGSPITALNMEQLISSGNIRPDLIDTLERDIFHDEYYEYSIEPIYIQITDETGKKKSKHITCECVKDWYKSLFCKVNPNRQALIGRDLLLEFPIEVKLDGKKKKTYVYL